MDLMQILMLFSIFMLNPLASHARTKRARQEPQSSIVDEENFESDEEEDDEADGSGDDSDEDGNDDPQMPWGEAQWLSVYAKHMANRNIMVERSVRPSIRPKVDNQLSTRNWLGIGNLTNPCYVEFVRWFYASAIKNGKSSIVAHVKGVQVVVTPKLIGEVIGAPSVNSPTYPMKNLDFDSKMGKKLIRKALKELTNDKAVSFSKLAQGTLTVDYRFLHTIVCHNLLPVGHIGNITQERGLFMYCVMNGFSIDLPQLIFDHIASFISVHRRDKDLLPFGILISQICMRAKVPVSLNEAFAPRKQAIGIREFTKSAGGTPGASSSTTSVAGSAREAWMDQPPILSPMSACANVDDLIGAMDTFKMEQNQANQYMYKYMDAIYRQRSSDDAL